MLQPSLICDKHDEKQIVAVQNAAQALLLLQAPIYGDNDIINEILSSQPSLDEEEEKHEASLAYALEKTEFIQV